MLKFDAGGDALEFEKGGISALSPELGGLVVFTRRRDGVGNNFM